MENISQLKKLDDVLTYFETHFKDNPLSTNDIRYAIEKPFDFDADEINPILSKLVKDGYLDKFIIEVLRKLSPASSYEANENYYSITFEGRYFIQIGGYVVQAESNLSQQKQLEDLRKDQIKRDEFLKKLTGWIAFGAIVTAIYYIYLLWQELCWCTFSWQK